VDKRDVVGIDEVEDDGKISSVADKNGEVGIERKATINSPVRYFEKIAEDQIDFTIKIFVEE
jgi:hypothetical protein